MQTWQREKRNFTRTLLKCHKNEFIFLYQSKTLVNSFIHPVLTCLTTLTNKKKKVTWGIKSLWKFCAFLCTTSSLSFNNNLLYNTFILECFLQSFIFIFKPGFNCILPSTKKKCVLFKFFSVKSFSFLFSIVSTHLLSLLVFV